MKITSAMFLIFLEKCNVRSAATTTPCADDVPPAAPQTSNTNDNEVDSSNPGERLMENNSTVSCIQIKAIVEK